MPDEYVTKEGYVNKGGEKIHVPYNPLMPYDRIVFAKFKRLYDETYFVDISENAFMINAKSHRGKVVLPMISISRLGDYSIALDMYNDVFVRKGVRHTVRGIDEFSNERVTMHGLPVTLQYQVDIWATRRDVVDGMTAELLMELKERPHIKANIQDMGSEGFPVEFDFLVDESVVDNTSIMEFEDTGRFYRLTLTCNIPSAVIFRVDTFDRIEKEVITFNTDFESKEIEYKSRADNQVSNTPEDSIEVINRVSPDNVVFS